MYRAYRLVLAVLGLVLSLPAVTHSLSAQSVTSGSVQGTVRDAAERSLGGANLMLRDEETGITRALTATHTGGFEFVFLAPGRYQLRVEQFGYRPQVLTGVVVRADQSVQLPVVLRPVAGGEGVDSVAVAGQHVRDAVPGLRVQVSRRMLGTFPNQGRELADAARLTSLVDESLGMQGLPAGMGGGRMDGALSTESWLASARVPLHGVEQVEIVMASPDVEWSGSSGGTFDRFSRRGTQDLRVDAFGTWSNLVPGSGAGDVSTTGSAQGGFLLSGPLVRDTSSFAVGLEAWSLHSAGSLVQPQGSFGQALTTARDSFGVDLAHARRNQMVAGFGRVDWKLSDVHSLDLRANVTSLLSARGLSENPLLPEGGRPYSGLDAASALTLTSLLGAATANELRISADYNRRDLDAADPREVTATTRIVGARLGFGPEGSATGSLTQLSGRVSDALHIRSGDHRFKIGGTVGVSMLDHGYVQRPARFYFSGLNDFAAARGYFVAPVRRTTAASYTLPEASLFAQDFWNAGSGLSILLGLRLDAGWLPVDQVTQNPELFAATGLVNLNVDPSWMHLSPRAGFVWDVQSRKQLIVNGSLGVYTGQNAVAELGEFLANPGGVSVLRGYGAVGEWPGVPESSGESEAGTSLMLLAPQFAPPQSVRSSLSVTRALARNTTLRVASLYRHTMGLTRRADLNLLAEPLATDQHGRAVYGQLEKRGGILFPSGSSNRRFEGFDGIYAVNVDGWSRYAGVTLDLQHQPEQGIRWFASYTFSRTTDNQPTATATTAELGRAPAVGDSTRWQDGRSALDVPHRATVGLALPIPGLRGAEIAGLYRFRSGLPFTPGLPIGVDANGDGTVGNDPAFVDSRTAGTEEIAARWSCLASQMDRMAARNSCRTDGLHSLDLRLGVSLVRFGSYSAQLTVDGLNLLTSRILLPDAALYLMDESRDLVEDRAGGTVAVPLMANENFGNPLLQFRDGRTVRIGLRVNY